VGAVTSARPALDRSGGGGRCDGILSDVLMPGMTGMGLYAALSELQPAQAARMIFMTGGAFEPAAAAFLNRQTNPLIEKPFRPAVLRRTVDSALLALGPAG
jgi:CheY-like chemotaxis protein